MDFNFVSDRPVYIQLVEKLRRAIITGYYPSGTKLPSVRELALMAKVNPNTLQKALSDLESQKLIYTERTNGKYVTNDKELISAEQKKIATELTKKYISDMKSIGVSYSSLEEYLQETRE